MQRNLARLADSVFDLAIVGGGILGAGIARDAVLRGLNVALVEQGDFASGTSSRSTKLIHGGLRYLEHAAFGLVAEACRERSILLRNAPHLVRPLSFLLPAYAGDERSLTLMRLGTTIYDWLTPRDSALPGHRTLSPSEAIAEEPSLPSRGLRGAVLFYDCQMDDARLCLETILDAARQGAACANYCVVAGWRRERDRITALQVVDRVTQAPFDVRAKIFVNATGPWVEHLTTLATLGKSPFALSPTKGAHLLLPVINRQHGLYFQSRRDRRMIFLLPWDELSLLGTTDTDFRQPPEAAAADADDVSYLLGELQSLLPDRRLEPRDLITSFAGVRALLRADRHFPSRRSREERIAWQTENLLCVAGGKYTTFRSIADKVVRKAARRLKRKLEQCPTASSPLANRRPVLTGEPLSKSPPVFASDIVHACREEMALTLADVMRRRTRLALSRHGDAATAERVSRIMAEELDWNEHERQQQIESYLVEWDRSRPWLRSPS